MFAVSRSAGVSAHRMMVQRKQIGPSGRTGRSVTTLPLYSGNEAHAGEGEKGNSLDRGNRGGATLAAITIIISTSIPESVNNQRSLM